VITINHTHIRLFYVRTNVVTVPGQILSTSITLISGYYMRTCSYVLRNLQARGRAKTLQVYVTSVHWYRSFERMLTMEKLHNCLPTVKSVEDGCKIYRSFPGSYREKTHGVLAFRISPVVNQSQSAPLSPLHTSCSQRTTFNTPSKRNRDDDGGVPRQSKLQKRLVFSTSQRKDIQTIPKPSHDVSPPRMPNPYNSVKHSRVWNVCYINSVLQLLASSDACINQCNNVKGVVTNLLSSIRAGMCSISDMDCLFSQDIFQGGKKMFKLGEPNCAIEFMNWCVEEIQLNSNPTAITQTLIQQQCTTCKRTCVVKVKGGPYGRGNGSCLELVSGKAITDCSEFDDRIQDCWRNDCPSANSLSRNLVRFREIRLHGEVVIYYWNAPCLQLQLQKYLWLTVSAQRNTKRRKYRLCGFTVFESSTRHYITYRYVSDKLYCCNDYDIRISNHTLTFSTADKRCVMVIYEMVDVNNEVVRAQDVSKRHSKCSHKDSVDKRGNRHVPIPSLISTTVTTSVKPSALTGDGLPHHWTAVHGDGFCWIYAFLV